MRAAPEAVASTVRDVFADAGAHGWLHACPVGADADEYEVGVGADDPVALASVYKLFVLAAFARAVDDGVVDPTAAVTLSARHRTPGPTGVAAFRDEVTLSWRDAAKSMITVSDNAAADAVLATLGRRRVADTVAALGLVRTTIVDDAGRQLRALLRDTATRSEAAAHRALADLDRVIEPSGYDPVRTSASTPREVTMLLRAFWTDTAASRTQCAFARAALQATFGPYRLQHGFAGDEFTLAHKTGTLGALRHDAGVVEVSDGCAFAVAVFTRAARPDRVLPAVDAAIGRAARIAVDAVHLQRHQAPG